jgi:Ca2+:H+ antiporter
LHPGQNGPGSANNTLTVACAILLLASLGAVIVLAEGLAPGLEAAVERAGAPDALVGIIVAAMVLMPEALAALPHGRIACRRPLISLWDRHWPASG